ncbi:MAG: phenylalanine--tRNA ligase subunit beta [Deltaproteobacteria bacterium]|nr:phenylalanine--tRNA ligase subunit beta [Deltaproteobacteria bacterium]
MKKVTTLDEQERKLTAENLLICDAENPVAIAGVMGCENSLVTDETTSVFIESAYFDPPSIRRTSKALGLATESSYRFERGVDIEGVVTGLHRAGELMRELGGGQIVPGFIDAYPQPRESVRVACRPSRANTALGTKIDPARMKNILDDLELSTEIAGEDELTVSVPSFRVDIEREIDVIEEIGRHFGFDNIAATYPPATSGAADDAPLARVTAIVRETLCAAGFHEFIGVSMTSPDVLDRFHSAQANYVRIVNPISRELSTLRDRLLPSLCVALARNVSRQIEDVALFEVRRVYQPADAGAPPNEPTHLAALLHGRAAPSSWAQKDRPADFYDIKGAVESVFEALRLDGVSFSSHGRRSHHDAGMRRADRFWVAALSATLES